MSQSPQAIDSQRTAASIAKLTIQMDAPTMTYEEQSRVVNSCQVSPTHRRNKYISGKHHAQQDIHMTVLTRTKKTRESHNESPVVTSGNHNNNINSFLGNNSSMKLKEPPAIIKGGESDFSKSYWLPEVVTDLNAKNTIISTIFVSITSIKTLENSNSNSRLCLG